MRLLVFNLVGVIAMLIAFALGASGIDSFLIYLFVMVNAAADRVAQPLIARLRP